MNKTPKSHPRHVSLKKREEIVRGVDKSITSIHGLIAHGRGEAFDYLIGEKTNNFAEKAICAAAALLLLSKKPVISVNGNAAALVGKKLVKLSKMIPAPLEVNIFHTNKKREKNIKKHLIKLGGKNILMPGSAVLKGLSHNRKYCNKNGIYKADVVFVPLEDGDRCLALKKMDKKVITIDLNPMSRTAKAASVTIVDNVIRTLPLLIKTIKKYKSLNKDHLNNIIKKYDNKENIKKSLKYISKRFS